MRSKLLIAGLLLAITTAFSSCIVDPGYYGGYGYYHGGGGGWGHHYGGGGCHHSYGHRGGYYR